MDSLSRFIFQDLEQQEGFMDFFGKIKEKEIKTKNIELYSQIHSSTKKIFSYFEKSIQKFPSLFEKNLESFEDCLNYLEKNSIPNKCVCAGIIDTIPGWRCVDCSKYENSILCNDCYLNSKDWHKGHKLYFLMNSIGMCDCGDPDSLYQYCREHSGPFEEEKDIESYIQLNFGKKIVDNLRKFFDEFFIEFSKYLILTSKCELFMEDLYNEKFKGDLNDELFNEKNDVNLLKSNFCIVFQNLIYFLRLITKKNLGMFHLIANYFLKNNLESIKLGDEYLTDHRCIELSQKDIKIYYDTVKKESHFCKCPFLRLFITNYRDDVKLDSKEDEQEFLFSFAHNLPLRKAFCILYYFLFNQILYNKNTNLIYCRTQFYIEDGLEMLVEQTNFVENSIDLIYKYLLRLMKQKGGKEQNIIKDEMIRRIYYLIANLSEDIKYYSKPKVRLLMTTKTSYFKKFIDLTCLFQNIFEFISIVPHPSFQDKSIDNYLYEIESRLSIIPGLLNCCFDWKQTDKLKEIYGYIIYKILNQKKEGINQLEDNEFSFFFSLYRSFGVFMNAFCFNYSFQNKCPILESINFFKKNFFESQEQIEKFVEIVLKDYYKLFGFLIGCKNNFFKYYDRAEINFPIYTGYNYYKYDFTLLKYLFVLNEKEIDINSYLKLSNIENVYSTFDNIFNLGKIIDKDTKIEPIQEEPKENLRFDEINFSNIPEGQRELRLLRLILNEKFKKNDKSQDEFNIIMQWKTLIEFLIFILKDDSTCYWSLINIYDDILSSKTRADLFDNIRNNKYVMNDLKNVLKENIILNILSQGNLIDKQKLEKNIDKYLLILFEENNLYEEILNEMTYNKMSGETRLFYLKDEYLKYLDYNYFVNLKNMSATQKYILNFKKDVVKSYNYYYYNQSELTFEFFEKVYEKVLLSKDNLDLIIRIVETLINNEKIMLYLDKKSIRNTLLPTILNYLLMLSVINTKSFIEFKLENKDKINKLYEILHNIVNNEDKKDIIDKDLEEHIHEVLNKINTYQIINDSLLGDFSKLEKLSYNTNILEQLKNNQNYIVNNINNISEGKEFIDEKKQKSKNAKEKLKLLMKKKTNNFMKKIESNEEMTKAIEEHINDLENMKNKDDEIMCFYCRNSIKLNSYEEPFGKLGLNIKDLFYINSIKATLRDEFSKLILNEEDNNTYSEILKSIHGQKYFRIISCGHYFHYSCFNEGIKKNNYGGFICPLCLKEENILIPPLTLFHDKYCLIKSEKFDELFEEKTEKEEKKESDNNSINLFDNTVIEYLTSLNVFKSDIRNYNRFLEDIYPYYQAYLNYFENIFYVEGTTFHKQQQIDNIKNLILSLRLIFHNSKDYNKNEIVEFIKETIFKLACGPEEKEYIYKYYDSYMHYINLFEKIALSLQILFDYEEFHGTFKYIIYIFLPYFCFGIYFKKLMIEKNNNKLNKEEFEKKLNINEFQNYLEDDNKQILKYLNSFLKKFCFIKLISDYKCKNEDIINNYNDLSFKNILLLIDMEDFAKLFPKNEISIKDIINNLPKIFNTNDTFYKLFSSVLSFENVLTNIIKNVKNNKNEIDFEITKELMIQFIPPKFNFINLDKNIFDFIEKYIGIKCSICKKIKKHSFLCLICGEKVCGPKNSDDAFNHMNKCTSEYSIFIDMDNMKLHLIDNFGKNTKLYPIYVNKAGTGPKESEISNEFNLSNETLKTVIKNYASKDFYFN